jgi:hypothetical protein
MMPASPEGPREVKVINVVEMVPDHTSIDDSNSETIRSKEKSEE